MQSFRLTISTALARLLSVLVICAIGPSSFAVGQTPYSTSQGFSGVSTFYGAGTPASAGAPCNNPIIQHYYQMSSSSAPVDWICDNRTGTYQWEVFPGGGTQVTSSAVATSADVPIAGSSVLPTNVSGSQYDTITATLPFVPASNSTNLRAVFTNFYSAKNGSVLPENAGPPLTVRAALEYPAGVYYPIFYRGQRDAAVDPGGFIVTDPISVDVPAGAVAWIRYRATRTSGTAGIPGGWYFGFVTTPMLGSLTTTRTGGHFDGLELLRTRTVSDGVTNGTTTITSATAAFVAQDAGQTVTINGTAYTLSTITNSTTAVVSAAVPGSATGVTFAVAPADKTTSGTIASASGNAYSPMTILGQVAGPQKSACIIGDSISYGTGSGTTESWAIQALNQAAIAAGTVPTVLTGIPWLNVSLPSDTIASYLVNHQSRASQVGKCNYVLQLFATNDVFTNLSSLASVQANALTLWQQEKSRGAKVYAATLLPRNTSTDYWLTTANQTVLSPEPVRVGFNNWLRDGAPVSSTTGLAVAVGSSSSATNRAAFYDQNGNLVNAASGPGTHPLGAAFELANVVETAQDSGLWIVDPANRTVTDGVMNSGSAVLTSATAAFASADVGHYISVGGAGTSGATIAGALVSTYTSATQVTISVAATTSVTGAQTTIGGAIGLYNNADGIHPDVKGHALLGTAASKVVATWQ